MPISPPDNGSYMIAGYVVTAVIVLVYVTTLWSRSAKALAEADGAD